MKFALLILFSAWQVVWAAPSTRLTFEQALNAIKERSVKLQSQKENVRVVRNRNLPSSLSYLPTLGLSGNQAYSKNMPAGSFSSERGVTASASINLFHFGADAAAVAAASSENEAQDYLLQDLELTVENDGVSALVAFIQAAQTKKVIEKILESRKLALSLAQKRYEKGLIARQETDKFLVDNDNSQAQLQDAEIQLNNSRNQLLALLGDGDVDLDWTWKELFRKTLSQMNDFSQDKLEQRPEIIAQQLKVSASNRRSYQALGAVLPSLDAKLDYSYTEAIKPAPESSSYNLTGTVTITLPIFDRLRDFGEYRALVHQKAQTEIELERLRRNARADLDSARTAFSLSYKSVLLRDRNLERSRLLYEDNLKRFQRAIVNANDLMNDQERLYQSELSSIRGWGEVHNQFAKLCHSIGRSVFNCLNKE